MEVCLAQAMTGCVYWYNSCRSADHCRYMTRHCQLWSCLSGGLSSLLLHRYVRSRLAISLRERSGSISRCCSSSSTHVCV